ncbi:MAG: hypothetical protein AB4080_07330 [Trichodesmium sp.]
MVIQLLQNNRQDQDNLLHFHQLFLNHHLLLTLHQLKPDKFYVITKEAG